MRLGRLMWAAAPLLLGACQAGPPAAGNDASSADQGENLPQPGTYHVVREMSGVGNETHREESDQELSIISHEALVEEAGKDEGSRCRDKQVSVSNGVIAVRMTCSAPDGDLNNIRVERNGTYSSDSLELITRATVMGMTMRESVSYRRKS